MNLENKNEPLITIITVVRNAPESLEKTIKNIISLNRQDIEYIIIDGHSEKQTINVIKRYQDKLTLWISEEDNGIYDAMNKGWKLAKSSYILFLGAGDTIIELPKNIQTLETKIIFFGKVKIGKTFYKSEINSKIKLGNTLHHQALLIHKSMCPVEAPFDTKYKVYADYDFNLRLHKKGCQFVKIDDFSAFAEPNGLSSTIYLRELLSIIRTNCGIVWAVIASIYHLYQGLKYGFHRYLFK